MTYLLLIIGFLLLIKGADYFVDGASTIAKLLNIPPILIGLTIVAFGTSSPEAAVSISAAIKGSGDISLGNVVGSNMFNITAIIGITSIINPLKVERETIRKEIPFALLASIALFILISDVNLQFFNKNLITRSDGLILLLFFLIFLYYIFEVARNSREKVVLDNEKTSTLTWGRNIFFTLAGLGAIIYGGDLVVKSSTEIAYSIGMSQTLVGLTIVAIGTSLPELITSITAAMKKQSEIALGNIIGSNIFNILFVLGSSSLISPISVDNKIFTDVMLMILFTIVLLYFSKTHSKVSKLEGSILTLVYLAYTAFIIIRN